MLCTGVARLSWLSCLQRGARCLLSMPEADRACLCRWASAGVPPASGPRLAALLRRTQALRWAAFSPRVPLVKCPPCCTAFARGPPLQQQGGACQSQQLMRCWRPSQALAEGRTRRSQRVARRAGGGGDAVLRPASAARRSSVGPPLEAVEAAQLTQNEQASGPSLLPAAAPRSEAAPAAAAPSDPAREPHQQRLQRQPQQQQQQVASQRLTSRLLWEHDAAQRQQAGAALAAAAARDVVAAAASPFLQPAAASEHALPPLPTPADLDAFLRTSAPSRDAAAGPQPPAARASTSAAEQPQPLPFGRLPRAQQLQQQAERRLSTQPSFGSWLVGEPSARRSSDATLLAAVAEEPSGSLGGGGGSAKGAPASVAPPSTIHADTWRSLIDLGITSPPSGEPPGPAGQARVGGERQAAHASWRCPPFAGCWAAKCRRGWASLAGLGSRDLAACCSHAHLPGHLPQPPLPCPSCSCVDLKTPAYSRHTPKPLLQVTQPWWALLCTSALSPAAPSPPPPCSSSAPCSKGEGRGCAPAAACGGEMLTWRTRGGLQG